MTPARERITAHAAGHARESSWSDTVSVSRSETLNWFTIRDGADRATVDATHRAVLQVQRPRLEDVTVDLTSDAPWPEEVQWAVDEADQRAIRTRSFFGRSWTRRAGYIDLNRGRS